MQIAIGKFLTNLSAHRTDYVGWSVGTRTAKKQHQGVINLRTTLIPDGTGHRGRRCLAKGSSFVRCGMSRLYSWVACATVAIGLAACASTTPRPEIRVNVAPNA